MKEQLRLVFSPVLKLFEKGSGPYKYKPLNRKILVIMGLLFSGLAAGVFYATPGDDIGYLLPVIVFSAVGVVCILVGFLGSDRAVSKIWGNR
ncbi:MAG TPA: hypothetical protein ENI64_07555 [Gammaproteobacteria bacterium]|nr:hypothetical protein [Gammaproteobacteria bacterium]